MGLDVSHGAFRGAYSSFDRFRKAVCLATGEGAKWDTGWRDGMLRTQWLFGGGRHSGTNPGLYAFFCHSDCDGHLTPEECAAVADEMEEILPVIDAMGGAEGHLAELGYGGVARRWIAGCRAAAAAGENLEFG